MSWWRSTLFRPSGNRRQVLAYLLANANSKRSRRNQISKSVGLRRVATGARVPKLKKTHWKPRVTLSSLSNKRTFCGVNSTCQAISHKVFEKLFFLSLQPKTRYLLTMFFQSRYPRILSVSITLHGGFASTTGKQNWQPGQLFCRQRFYKRLIRCLQNRMRRFATRQNDVNWRRKFA